MTKSELTKIFTRLDKAKFDLLDKGYTFDFMLIDRNNDYMHTGIGTGENMSRIALINLYDLFNVRTDKSVNIEQYAESVKRNLIKFAEMQKD